MAMTIQDEVIGAECAWRENRGGGEAGIQSVLNVLCNRAMKHGTSVYTEATKRLQFSSMTAPGNPELALYAAETDPLWAMALGIAAEMASGSLPDITDGAIDYYAPRGIKTKLGKTFTLPDGTVIPFPDDWNESAVTYTCEVAGQVFFK